MAAWQTPGCAADAHGLLPAEVGRSQAGLGPSTRCCLTRRRQLVLSSLTACLACGTAGSDGNRRPAPLRRHGPRLLQRAWPSRRSTGALHGAFAAETSQRVIVSESAAPVSARSCFLLHRVCRHAVECEGSCTVFIWELPAELLRALLRICKMSLVTACGSAEHKCHFSCSCSVRMLLQ